MPPTVSITARNSNVLGLRSRFSFRYWKTFRKTTATPPPRARRSPETSCVRGLSKQTKPSGVIDRSEMSSGSEHVQVVLGNNIQHRRSLVSDGLCIETADRQIRGFCFGSKVVIVDFRGSFRSHDGRRPGRTPRVTLHTGGRSRIPSSGRQPQVQFEKNFTPGPRNLCHRPTERQ